MRKLDVRILVWEIIRTPRNAMIILRCTDYVGRKCSDLGVGGWVSRNLHVVQIFKSVRIIGGTLRLSDPSTLDNFQIHLLFLEKVK